MSTLEYPGVPLSTLKYPRVPRSTLEYPSVPREYPGAPLSTPEYLGVPWSTRAPVPFVSSLRSRSDRYHSQCFSARCSLKPPRPGAHTIWRCNLLQCTIRRCNLLQSGAAPRCNLGAPQHRRLRAQETHGGGFGPVHHDGYGVSYPFVNDASKDEKGVVEWVSATPSMHAPTHACRHNCTPLKHTHTHSPTHTHTLAHTLTHGTARLGTGTALARHWPGTGPALARHWPGTGPARHGTGPARR